MALTGEGRALDYAAAKEHFQRASDRGFAAAKFNLALMYERGVGVERDPERAARLFAAAERQQASDVVSTDVRTAATLPATADTIEAVTAINDHVWIRGQNPKPFTLQLVSGESQTAIADILQTVPGLERAIFSKLLNGQRRFVGIAGNFDAGDERSLLWAIDLDDPPMFSDGLESGDTSAWAQTTSP